MYFGMLRALREHYMQLFGVPFSDFLRGVRGFSGTSIGAVAALIMLLDLSNEQIETVFRKKMANLRSVVPNIDLSMLVNALGLDDGSVVRASIVDILESGGLSASATFSDLERLLQKQFVCVSTNVHTKKAVYFCASQTPSVRVVDAVYMSMSVPFLLAPMRHEGHMHVDGCLSHNMPTAFPPEETLYIAFAPPKAQARVDSLADYVLAISSMATDASRWFEAREYIELRLPDAIDEEMALNFDILPCVQQMRETCGYASTLVYLYPKLLPSITSLIVHLSTAYRGPQCDL